MLVDEYDADQTTCSAEQPRVPVVPEAVVHQAVVPETIVHQAVVPETIVHQAVVLKGDVPKRAVLNAQCSRGAFLALHQVVGLVVLALQRPRVASTDLATEAGSSRGPK
jgi:hypothetical protein